MTGNKKQLFVKKPKDLTTSVHFSIRKSLVTKIKNDAKKYQISASKVVDTIIGEYYKKSKK